MITGLGVGGVGVTLNKGPLYNNVLPIGGIGSLIKQRLKVGLIPLTITPNHLLEEFVCTFSLLCPGSQRENAHIRRHRKNSIKL
jgi:hypothetical protein